MGELYKYDIRGQAIVVVVVVSIFFCRRESDVFAIRDLRVFSMPKMSGSHAA